MPLTINEENAHQEFTCNQLQEIEIPTGKTIQCILATADYLNEEFNGTSKTLLETINFEQNVTYHVENLNDTEYFIFNSDDYCVIVIVTPDTKENLQPLCEKIKNSQLIPASPDDEDKIAGIFGCEKEQFHFVENTTQLRETGASKANEYFPESSFGRDETMTFSTFINMASLPIFVNEASKAGPLENALGEMASNLFGGPPPEQAAPAEQQDANPLDVLNQASGLIPQQEGGEAAPEPEGGEAAPEPAPEGGEAAPEPAAEPAPEGGEPAAEPAPAGGEAAAEPAAEGGEPAPEGGEPPVEEKSVPEGGEPAPEGGEAAAEPAPEGGEPAAEGGEPAAEGGEPAAEGGEPAPEGGEPAEEGGEPAAEGGETAPEGGEPAAEGGETAPEGGEPAEEGGETAPEGGEPAPEEGEAAAEPAPEGGEPAAEGGETAPEGGEPAAEGGEDENVLEKLAKGTSGLFNGEDNNEDGEKAEKEIENATEDREQQSETTADFSKTAAGILDGILVQQPEEGENAEGHGEEPPVNELETPEIVAEEEEEHQEENKLEENLNVLDNLFGDQNPDEIAREYVYDEDPLSIPEGLDVHERYLLNHVTELQILSTQEEHIRCLYSATKDANVFYNYCKYLKLGPVTTFHFSSNPTDTGIDKFFSFCTGRELIALVNPTPQQIEIAIRSLNNSYVIPCSIEDKEELRTYENVPPIKRYASKAMVNFVNEQIIKQKEALGLDYAHESPSTYSSFLSICIDTYLGYLASYSSDECERDLKPGHEYTYEHVKCSIFDRDFDTSDLLGINNVREIELAPNHFVKCVFSATEDNVLEKYLSFIHFGRAISYHFSTSPNGRVNYFSLCSGRDLIVFVNPAQEQLNMVIDKIKSSYAIPCGTNDKDQLFFYDYLNNVKNISPDSDIPQIHEEINQVRSLGYPRELVYDVASSYEKFLYIAYTTFLGYYIRSQFFEPVAHPIEFKRYNIKDFISLRGLDYGKTLALNWGEGKVYILKKYRDDFKFNQALYLYKTKRMSCIVPFFGEIREDENYLVFGLGARGTLKEAVSKEHLDITTCKRITIELAFALAYLNMTGTKPCSVNPDHVSVCWDYHVHLTDYDETERVINCTPEQMDALNLGSVLYTLVTGEKTSSISSKSIPSTFGPISRIFEFCKKPDVTACDVVSEILTDKGFLQESDLIDRLLRELPNDYSTISVTDSWQIDYFRTDCTNVNDSILNSIKILRFGPVTSFHFIENKDEQSEETKRTFVYESNDTCGTITNIQPKVANIITSKMRNTTIVPVNDKDLDTLFEYYNFDLIQNFARNPQLSVFREDSQKAYDNFNTFKDKDLTQETLALSYAINHQPKPIEEEESEQQPPQFPQVSLLNPRFNLQTPMPSDEVKEIEVFTDFVVKCLYSTGEDYTYNEFVKAFGDDKFTTVHFSTDENTNEEYVSFCTSKRLLLLPASKNNENNEKQVNNQVNKTINHVKAIKVIGIGSDDRSSLFGFTNFDNIQKFATTTEMDQLKEKVETSKQELLPNDLSFNDTMTYSSYFKHAGDAVTGYYVLVNPNYVPPNPLERTIDQSIDFFGQSFDKVNESQNNPPSILVDESDEKKAFDLYMKAAERDDPAALFNLGLMYSRGQGVEKDKTKAAEYYEKAAARGNPKAQFNLGLMYAKGEGVPEDKAKAAQLYEQAANQGNAKAQSNLGLMYSRGDGVEQNYDKAVELYEKAAAQNDADAQLNLGLMYDQGEGVPVDKEKAVDLYTKSAQNGNAKAQFNLGVMYHKGEEGVIEKDNKKAVELYSMAAAKGVAQAQFNLGVLYSKGDVDVPQDKERAVQLFQMAADQGDADAQLNLGAMYAKGEGVEKDKNKTVELYTKAAEQNNPKAQFNLGVMYSKGDGVEKNPAEAAKYYQQAADQNIPQALFNLGVLYFKGAEGVPEDKAKAAELFEKAAELNPKNTKALFNLAVMYQKGEGVEKDEAKALELYERAAELNNRDALLNLGVMYGEGSGGVDQDKELALDYYKRAADLGNAKAQLNLGLMYQRGDGCEVDKQKAKEYFQKAADQGNQQAQLNLGLLLLGGDDNEQDKAEELLQQAAENGNVDAMIGLARRYQQDDDIPNAIKWYSEAANQGNPQAQLELGKIFLNGEGENVDYDKAETFLQAAADGGVNEALLYLGELYEKQEEPEKAKQFYIQARSLNVEGAAEKLKDNDSASEAFADRQPPSNEEKNEDDQQHESDHKQENQPEDDEKADNESNGEPIIQEEEEAKSEKQEQEPEQEKESEPEQEKEPEQEQESTQEPEQEKEPEPEPERDEIDLLYESLENRIKALHDISNEPYNDIDSALSEINDLFISRGLTECLNTYNKANTALRTTEDDAESLINEVKESINNSSLPSLRRDSKGHISMNLPNGFLPLEGFESSNSLSSTTVYSDDEELSRMKSEVRTLESQIDQINQRIEYSRSAPSTTTQTKPRVTAPRSTGSALSSGRNSGSNSGTEFVSLVVEPDTPRRAPAKKIYQPTETPNSTTSPRSCPSPRTARNKIKNLMSKAENGDAKAQYSLGACYALGEGVAQDKKKALEYYLLAAEQGDRNAQFAAAACYSYGKGTEQDKNRAFELYLQAAIQGHDKAQFAVGHFYEYGQGGVEQDHDKAVEWYRKAAAQGHQAAIDVLRSESEEGPANLRDYSEEDLP